MIALRAGEAVAEISPGRGAICTGLRFGDQELLYLDQSTFVDLSKNVRGGIPILFPIAGKPPEGSVLAQHGWARNLSWQPTQTSAASLECRLANDGFDLLLTYTLSERSFLIEMQIQGDGPFQLGFHPYFACTDKAAARVDTKATRALDNQTGNEFPYSPPDFLNTQPDLRLLDHREGGTILHRGAQPPITLRFSPEFKLLVLWTQPDKPFVCVEPWTDRFLQAPQSLSFEISL
jgi:galactose mutarotase-like enzyme